ncbi:uncharacterized protein LOC128965326 [Oppia nitens]|uniref:uncharacterized protein LOC128965326 n=1 Tax=Oppia nitens TaxID=1686743 RepID=UPI0023DCC375|nr:uncharacterized protein LOC128965326 [Oppia nitens]
MNRLVAKRPIDLVHKSCQLVSQRLVTYDVKPTGEKVVVNIIPQRRTKKEEWMNVRPMGYEPTLRQIKNIEFDPRLESDPSVARQTASNKLRSMKDQLMSRGFCREIKPYDPPEEVENIIKTICFKVLSNKTTNERQNWSHISLDNRNLKFTFLNECSKQLNYEIPNSMLYLMKSVSDVFNFYSTPIRGVSSYEKMVQMSDTLPQNLHVIPEPILYNQETDTFFGGINAYPFSTYRIKGLRAKKKYQFKDRFVWPDV